MQYNGSWWRVCSSSSYFRYQEATVVCRHLGYGTLGRLTSASGSSLASESRLQITCRGDENTLSRCSITPRQSCSSSYRQPVVECTNRSEFLFFSTTNTIINYVTLSLESECCENAYMQHTLIHVFYLS